MTWTHETLLAFLSSNQISIQAHQHTAVLTMEDSANLGLDLPGTRCKNLLVQNKKGSKRYLVTTPPDAAVDLSQLGKLLESGRLSLSPSADMMELLGVAPGAMSPFALAADQEQQQVQLIMDEALATSPYFQFHPLINTMTVAIDQENFKRFLSLINHTPQYLPIPRRLAAPIAE